MDNEMAAGFWSYAHDDNKLDNGAILQLACLIAEEYDLISAEPLKLFIDRDIAWGEEWRKRIDEALSQTTFLIPIITPRYFTRPECRRELLEFSAKAKSLGVSELVLPILYTDVRDLSSDSSDEAVALIARTQYVDWRINRLLDPASSEYRTSVNSLAKRLLDIAEKVANRQLEREVTGDYEGGGADGISDTIEKLQKILPSWLEAVRGEKIAEIQAEATWHELWPQVTKLQKSYAPASAILAAQIRIAREILPLVERGQKEWKAYAAGCVELDPLVSTLARQVAEHPECYGLASSVRAAVNEANIQIHINDEHYASGGHGIGRHLAEMKHLGRIFQKCEAVYRVGSQAKAEGDEIVRRWAADLLPPDSVAGVLDNDA